MSVAEWCFRLRATRALETAERRSVDDLDAACAAFGRAVRLSRRFPELERQARFRRAEALAALGRPAESAAELEHLAADGQGEDRVRRMLAQQLEGSGATADAIEAWRSVLGISEDDEQAHGRLADLLLGAGRPHEALAHLQWIALRSNRDLGAWRRLAEVLAELGDLSDAADAWVQIADQSRGAREKALELLEAAGRRREATAHVRALAEATPTKVKGWARLARRLGELGEAREAALVWRQVLDMKPEDDQAQAALAALIEAFQPRSDAVPHYRALIAVRPQDAGLRKTLAALLLETGQDEAAAAAWRDAVELAPEDLESRERLAALLVGLKRQAEAIPHLKAHAEAQPRRAKLWRRVAAAQESVGEAAAADSWEQALSLEPSDAEARRRLVVLLRELGDKPRLAVHLRPLAQTDAGSAETWRELARLLEELEKPAAECIEAWRQVIQGAPADGEAHSRLAALLWDSGDRVGAAPHLQCLAAVEPPRAKTWRRLALARQGLRDVDGEIAALQALTKLDGDDLPSRRRLALLLWENRQHGAAAPHLRALLKQGAGSPKELRRLARSLHETADDVSEQARSLSSVGEVLEEIAVWKQVLAEAPGDREAHARLAEAFWEMNRKAEAAPHLQIAAQAAARDAKLWRRLAAALRDAGDLDGEQAALTHLSNLEGPEGPAHRRLRQLADRRPENSATPLAHSSADTEDMAEEL
jgi:tetratricopeptide (TPR) repeat protein